MIALLTGMGAVGAAVLKESLKVGTEVDHQGSKLVYWRNEKVEQVIKLILAF